MMKSTSWIGVVAVAACASRSHFPLREPFTVDTDTHPVSVACRPDPTDKEPDRVTCTPAVYFSPFAWDRIDNTVFKPISHALAFDVIGEAANANSLDEVADSAWFTNRFGASARSETSTGICKPDDLLPADAPDGSWVIDHGKDNGGELGFRVVVPGKGKYLLKADEPTLPERASTAAVVGASLYNAVGFTTSCEQVVYIKRSQLKLMPGLKRVDNAGISHAFDEAALTETLKSSTHKGDLVRMQASKWLDGVTLGPFRYEGTRSDDPNDVVPHQNRRELRGSRVLAAWMNHWDARDQNSMDVWIASDPKKPRSSPGYVRHFIMDTSDAFGQSDPPTWATRMGHSYEVDFGDVLADLFTFGAIERPWDRAETTLGREKFGFFSARDFDPAAWKPLSPNPAFNRMTERDAAWMARTIAHVSPEAIHGIVELGQLSKPGDAVYLTKVLVERQQAILRRYLMRLSPIADVRREADGQICAVDLARLRGVAGPERFRYEAIEEGSGKRLALPVTTQADGRICFMPRTIAPEGLADNASERRVKFLVRNGTGSGWLEIHTYDLGAVRGMCVVGLTRHAP
jgi:hypothetical protein